MTFAVRGEAAQASGWLAGAQRLLEREEREAAGVHERELASVEHDLAAA